MSLPCCGIRGRRQVLDTPGSVGNWGNTRVARPCLQRSQSSLDGDEPALDAGEPRGDDLEPTRHRDLEPGLRDRAQVAQRQVLGAVVAHACPVSTQPHRPRHAALSRARRPLLRHAASALPQLLRRVRPSCPPRRLSPTWGGRPARAKTYGKKREHRLNSRDFDLTRQDNVPLPA
jgi:hypothetical protein